MSAPIKVHRQRKSAEKRRAEDTDMRVQQARTGIRPGPKSVSSNKMREAALSAFELVGGVTRLTLWADENYSEFLKIFGPTLMKAPPQSDANGPAAGGVVIQMDFGSAPEKVINPADGGPDYGD